MSDDSKYRAASQAVKGAQKQFEREQCRGARPMEEDYRCGKRVGTAQSSPDSSTSHPAALSLRAISRKG